MLRLDKLLANAGIGSRSQVKELIRKGRVLINGQPVKDGQLKIDLSRDSVMVDRKPVHYHPFVYYQLNKPKGVVSATKDNLHPTVLDLLKESGLPKDVFPVGRLDIDTQGLLLLTNDGELAHQLLSPKKHVDKVYLARISGRLPADAAQQMAAGLVLTDGTKTLPAGFTLIDADADGLSSLAQITVHQGMYHQVKRMVEALGGKVTALTRIKMGSLNLDESLRPGQYRPLTEDELLSLKRGKQEK